MDFITTVLTSARKKILALEIQNTGMLTDFLEEAAAIDLEITSRDMIDAAIKAGLYVFMGRQYQLGLDSVIALAGEAIANDIIATDDELLGYLSRKVPSIANGIDPAKTLTDLKIDARQGGLYGQLHARPLPAAVA